MRKTFAAAVAMTIAMVLCSCVSSHRMMRVSPLETQPETRFENTAVNLWPAYYGKTGEGAVLWPLADWDPKGFAIRPFFHRDEHEYAILFPFCAWNPVTGDGWVIPAYWNHANYGAVPFFHVGEELYYFGPVWYLHRDGEFGFFPLYRQNNAADGWFFPLYLYRWDERRRMILPLFGTVGMYREAGKEYHYRALTWFHVGDGAFAAHGILPFYYYRRDSDTRLLVTPLFGRGWDPQTGDTRVWDIAGPLFFRMKDRHDDFESIMWPLYIQSHTPDSTAYGSLPLFWYKYRPQQDKTELNLMWPLFSYNGYASAVNWSRNNFNLLGPFVFMNNRIYDHDRITRDNYIATLFFQYSITNDPVNQMPSCPILHRKYRRTADFYRQLVEEQQFSCFFVFKYGIGHYNTWSERAEDFSALENALIRAEMPDALGSVSPATEEVRKLQAKMRDTAQKNIVDQLQKLKLDVPAPTTNSEIGALRRLLYERYCRSVTRYRYGFPLLFDVDWFGADYDWNVFFYLARGEKSKDRELTAVLEYFYRWRRDGENAETLIFPFISRQTAPGKTRISFLWRVYAHENDRGKIGGYLFFIPYGAVQK